LLSFVGLKREGELFFDLENGAQAKALQYFFFAERKIAVPSSSDGSNKEKSVQSVGVVGGGTMGAGIAMSLVNAKFPVVLVESTTELAQQALVRIRSTYKASSAYKSGKLSDEMLGGNMALITATSQLGDLSGVDLVIEAVFENMKLKKELFAKLDAVCKPDAILATNTSCLDIDEIASATSKHRLANVVGTRKYCFVFAPSICR
jgi:3-hydroxyacyl-CoA dehydrogenase